MTWRSEFGPVLTLTTAQRPRIYSSANSNYRIELVSVSDTGACFTSSPARSIRNGVEGFCSVGRNQLGPRRRSLQTDSSFSELSPMNNETRWCPCPLVLLTGTDWASPVVSASHPVRQSPIPTQSGIKLFNRKRTRDQNDGLLSHRVYRRLKDSDQLITYLQSSSDQNPSSRA